MLISYKKITQRMQKEMWVSEKSNVADLKVFGCWAYAHVPKQKRQKLDSKFEECIFIRYIEWVKGYKLFKEKTKMYSIARM